MEDSYFFPTRRRRRAMWVVLIAVMVGLGLRFLWERYGRRPLSAEKTAVYKTLTEDFCEGH